MELTVKTENQKMYNSFVHFFQSLGIEITSETKRSRKKFPIDSVSLLTEKALAEEWNSKEDAAWDKVL